MTIEVAWQVHGWYQKNTDARRMLEKCPTQLGLERVSSADLPRTKAVPGKLGWERCLGPGGLGRKLSQAGRARMKVVWGGNHPWFSVIQKFGHPRLRRLGNSLLGIIS